MYSGQPKQEIQEKIIWLSNETEKEKLLYHEDQKKNISEDNYYTIKPDVNFFHLVGARVKEGGLQKCSWKPNQTSFSANIIWDTTNPS